MTKRPTFTRFVRWLGVDLEAGQLVYAKVAFDGVDPCDLPLGERELARELFGPVERVPELARKVVAAVCGARSGKTRLGALSLLYLALTVDVSALAPGESAFGIIVAPDLRLASQAMSYVRGAVASRQELAAAVVSESELRIVLRRDKRRTVTIEALPASGGGAATRGRNFVGAMLDEACFFRDKSYSVNDEDIYRSIAPRVLTGGLTLIQSTPWGKSGLLWHTHQQNFGAPTSALVAHAATSLMRSDANLLERVVIERARDPENARREFDAEFLDSDTQFLSSADVDACTRDDAELPPMQRAEHVACIDPASRANAFTLVVGRLDFDGLLVVSLAREWRPGAGSPLDLRAVVREVAAEVRRYGCDTVISDQWSGDALAALFDDCGVALQQQTLAGLDAAEAWQRLRTSLSTHALSLPRNAQLRADLCGVRRRVSSGGGVSFALPSTPDGRHADYAPALLRLSVTAKRLARPVDEDAARAERERRRRARDEEDQYEAKLLERQSADWRRSKGNDAWIRASNS